MWIVCNLFILVHCLRWASAQTKPPPTQNLRRVASTRRSMRGSRMVTAESKQMRGGPHGRNTLMTYTQGCQVEASRRCLTQLEILSYSGGNPVSGKYMLDYAAYQKLYKRPKFLTFHETSDPAAHLYMQTNDANCSVLGKDFDDVPFIMQTYLNHIDVKHSFLGKIFTYDIPPKKVTVNGNYDEEKLERAVTQTIEGLFSCVNEEPGSSSETCATWYFKALIINAVAKGVKTQVLSYHETVGKVQHIKREHGKLSLHTTPVDDKKGSEHLVELTLEMEKKSVLYKLQKAVALKYLTNATTPFVYELDEYFSIDHTGITSDYGDKVDKEEFSFSALS